MEGDGLFVPHLRGFLPYRPLSSRHTFICQREELKGLDMVRLDKKEDSRCKSDVEKINRVIMRGMGHISLLFRVPCLLGQNLQGDSP